MQTTKRSIGPAFLALFFLVAATPAHAEVYKWVDENGVAHYTDQPPKKGAHSELRIKAAPGIPQPESGNARSFLQPESRNIRSLPQAESENTGSLPDSMPDAHQQRLNEANARLQAARDQAAAQEKARSERWRNEAQQAETKKREDDSLVARCKRNRDVYCDKGADHIRDEESKRRADAEARFNRGW